MARSIAERAGGKVAGRSRGAGPFCYCYVVSGCPPWPGPPSQSPTAPLREWAGRIAARRGKGIAVVALVRRLVGVLFALLRDGTVYEQTRREPPAMHTAVPA